MDSHCLEERPDCVIEDRSLLWLVDVFGAQEIHQIARIHSVKSIKKHIEAILKVNKFAVFHVERMKGPTGKMIKDFEQIGKKGANRCRDDGQQ